MDFIVSYYLYSKIKRESTDMKRDSTDMKKKSQNNVSVNKINDISYKTCVKCGQEPYFCQCSNNIKLMYHNFNPEKDKY